VAVVDGQDHFSFRGVSPDGRRIAVGFSGGADSSRGIYLLDLVTRSRTTIPGLNNSSSFSPDGRYLISATYVDNRNTEILEYDLRTGRIDPIAPHPSADFLPSYSPDGRYIVFNSYRTGRSDLYLFDRVSRELRRLTTFEGYDAHAQFSPDGQRVVFHREVTRGNYDLVLLDLRTNTERALTTAPGEESYPAFSPRGDLVVYSDDRLSPGSTDLFVLNLRDNTTTRLTTNTPRAGYASWSRDGTYVYFTSTRSGNMGVYRIGMNGPACRATR
jgi:TolB protein